MASNAKFLEVGRIPRRKRPCLWVLEGSALRVLAYFRSEEALKEFMTLQPSYKPTGDGWLDMTDGRD